MTSRKLCGKLWPAHLCAPGAHHACTRPPHHPGQCACKCGIWATVRQTDEIDPEVTVVAGSMPPHQHSQPVDKVQHNMLIGVTDDPRALELAVSCAPCRWHLALEPGEHDLADFINLYAQHAGIDAARTICATTLYAYAQQHEEATA